MRPADGRLRSWQLLDALRPAPVLDGVAVDAGVAKSPKRKPWTSEDLKTLKKLARQKTGADKIAKTLKRTPAAVLNKAVIEQLSLSTR